LPWKLLKARRPLTKYRLNTKSTPLKIQRWKTIVAEGLPPEPASLIMADAVKLREALYNLTDNAVKYTEKGGVKVELQFVTKGKNNCAMIIVTDTGIGMTKEEAADVFGRQFERGKEAKKVYALGRGIGLFITASIIKAHKGKIWADSLGSGQGSAFYVELVAKK